MPRQKGDPPFRDDESLHRRLIAAWALDDDSVDPGAITFAQCSVDRGAFSTHAESLNRGTAEEVALASVGFGNLPSVFEPAPNNNRFPPKSFELVVVHEPENGNLAHTHLESHQLGEPEPKEPKAIMKQQIRVEIASKMRVVLRRAR